MDPHAAVNGELEVVATVVALLPHGAVRVELESREQVTAHAAGAAKANFVRLRPKDQVIVALSRHDRRRGRIIRLLNRE